MGNVYVLVALMLVVPMAAQARMDEPLAPSQATRRHHPPPAASGISLNAQTVDLTLGDAIYLGLRDNRAIRSAYLERVAQKFDLRVAEDRYTPKLMLSGSYLSNRNQNSRYRQGSVTPAATMLTPYNTRVSVGGAYGHTRDNAIGLLRNDGVGINVIQPLLRGAGKEIAAAPVQLARLNEQANRLNLKSTVSQTITQIIAAYRVLLQAQEQLKISQESLDRARRLVEVNRAMIAAGRMAQFEIVQTQAEVATQELAFEEARNRLDRARLALLQLLALDLNTCIVATEALNARPVDVDAAQALLLAEASQPAYLARLVARAQAAINLKLAKNDRLWDLSLVGGAGQGRNRSSFGGSTRTWETYVGVQVYIPIGDLSTRQAEVHAQVNVDAQRIQFAEARQQLERDVQNAVRDIGARWRQYEIAQRARDLSRRKREIEREKLTVGRSSNFQVLSFENDLRHAEYARLDALIAYLNAQAELDQTLGTTLQSWDIALND